MRAAWLVGLFVIGCTPGMATRDASVPDGASCPNDLPASCPAPIPSWRGAVQGIMQKQCVGCHGPGADGGTGLESYAQVYAHRQTVLDKIYDCTMPPAPVTLPADQRAILLGWLVCGAPDN